MAIDVERDAPTGVLTPLLPLPGEPEVAGDVARWHAVADEVALELGRDAAERDAANAPPFAEVDLLRRAGLINLVVPADLGGEGASFSTAYDVVRRIARTDGSIAQLLGYHGRFFLNDALAGASPYR